MKEYSIDHKRNIALAGHHASGKTSLVEAVLFSLGVIDRMGKTEDGNTFCDYTDEEKARHLSIYATLVQTEWKKTRINALDLPGFPDFVGEIKGALQGVDGVAIVLDGCSGVEVETERAWDIADQYHIPRIAVINKLDRERSDFNKVLEQMGRVLKSIPCVPFQLPIGQESSFKGVVDLIRMKAVYFNDKGKADKVEDIPADLADEANEYREKIMDFAAETDEDVMAKYLEGEALTEDEIVSGLKKGVAQGSFVPVFCASAVKSIGISTLLDAIVDYLPSPDQRAELAVKTPEGKEEKLACSADAPLCAYVFKTVVDPFAGRLSFFRVFSGTLTLEKPYYNVALGQSERANNILEVNGKQHHAINRATAGDIAVLAKMDTLKAGQTLCDESRKVVVPPAEYPPSAMQMALVAASKAEAEKLGTCLPRIVEEDPTLSSRRDPDTHELILYGMGDLQLNIVLDRLKTQFGLAIRMKVPKVAYKETITSKGDGKYRHKKQSGGRGQFGEVVIRVEPLPRGGGFEFVDAIVGGVIPAKFIASVEKGILDAMTRGIVAGFPVVDVKVTLYDGMTHDVDSSDIAFKIAGSMGFKQVASECNPILLEPVMSLEITVPEEYMGDIISDMNTKRGKILGMDPQNGRQIIKAQAPLSEVFQYSIDLRSISQARGSFKMEFSHYEPVPRELAQKIIEAAQREKTEEQGE
jgi:elongation factor G